MTAWLLIGGGVLLLVVILRAIGPRRARARQVGDGGGWSPSSLDLVPLPIYDPPPSSTITTECVPSASDSCADSSSSSCDSGYSGGSSDAGCSSPSTD